MKRNEREPCGIGTPLIVSRLFPPCPPHPPAANDPEEAKLCVLQQQQVLALDKT